MGILRILQPHYEKVARLFNGPNAVHTGEVYLAKVDCADQVLLEILASTLFCSLYHPLKVFIIFAGGLIYSPPISFLLILSVSLCFTTVSHLCLLQSWMDGFL